jgi:hypothetical protein
MHALAVSKRMVSAPGPPVQEMRIPGGADELRGSLTVA